MKSFGELGITECFEKRLSTRGITKPSAIQKKIIPALLEGGDIVFRSATGTGKTFAYLLPVLQKILASDAAGEEADTEEVKARFPEVLILAPTIELAAQIKSETDFLLDGSAVSAALLTSAGNKEKQIETLKKNKPRIITGNAQRIEQLADEKKLRLNNVRFVILDEADRLISDEMIEQTQGVFERLDIKRPFTIICCSATVSVKTKAILNSIVKRDFVFFESEDNDILQNYISHWAIWCEHREKPKRLRSFLHAVKAKRALIFAERAEEINRIAGDLRQHKIKATALYSGMDKKIRKAALDGFRRGAFTALVSSDLAARGLDIPEIKYVISLGTPFEAEAYIHRAGRTGRAGKKGIAVSIGNETELRRLSSIEKKLHIVIYPKILYNGMVCSPDLLENHFEDEGILNAKD
jgi:superfamily II DNA/RNA helicase